MKKILFLIHDLGQGGAEKVLVNLVNNMDRSKFDITVVSLFGGGVNEQFLSPDIKYRAVFSRMIPGNSHIMKLFSPKMLHKMFIKEKYDIEVAYLEGPSARIVSGCTDKDTKLVSWIHVEQHSKKAASAAFRSENEALRCYNSFDRTICVSKYVMDDFAAIYKLSHPTEVLYNTVESDAVIKAGREPIDGGDGGDGGDRGVIDNGQISICGIGSLKLSKGFDRLIRIHKRLRDRGLPVHTYILGKGPERENLLKQAEELGVSESVTLLGYQTNPYKYVAKCDMFVCTSFAEGFSTAATEALILGVPVCTVEVSGMKEMLGESNEYGIVTENDEDALFEGIYEMLTAPGRLEHYRAQAALRGRNFRTEETVRAVEEMLINL